jgi:hypothetical protein
MLIFKSRARAQRGFDLDALGSNAIGHIRGGAGAGGAAQVPICSAEVVTAAVDRLDQENRSVEGVELEILELLAEYSRADAERAARIFRAQFERVVDLRIELEVPDERLRTRLATERQDR